MKPEQIVAILVRLGAFGIGLYTLRFAAQMVWVFENDAVSYSGWAIVGVCSASMTVAILLWTFPVSVAHRIVPSVPASSHAQWSHEELYSFGFVIVGIFTLYLALSDSAYWLFYAFYAGRDSTDYWMLNLENKAAIFGTLIEIIFAIYLIIGSKDLTKLVFKIRYSE